MSGRVLIIGTRGSDLALEQARRVHQGLEERSEIKVIRTAGDQFRDKPLGEASQVGFFTKEIEEELLEGRIDLAVHSLKDLPTALAQGLELGAVMKRDDPADILLLRSEAFDSQRPVPLKEGATVGASSLRRQALLAKFGQSLVPVAIRGNVPTRIRKAVSGECDAIIISRAGLERLQLEVSPLVAYEFNPRVWPCAPGQGTIAVEIRAGDSEVRERLSTLNHQFTHRQVQAERCQLVAYGGGCHVPFGAYAGETGDGFDLFVAAPGEEGFDVHRFQAENLEEASRAAEAWIRAGGPARDPGETGEWMCRPARSWC